MISHCANANCAKPLLYLREGRIFVFDFPDHQAESNHGKSQNRMGHYWICGDCAEQFTLRQNSVFEVELCPKEPGTRGITQLADGNQGFGPLEDCNLACLGSAKVADQMKA